ncbi:ribosomal protein S10 domain-containing protein [Desarmillaria tabescens]|uniref:Small ribosomal subunit protein uS10m n=1 Tax=Armillaria tabescens TaxID=1929756 RepID=A0AA39T3B0_ARMTA|nr:ribosomal protein S10 domain-containing protein [Desarmillaria tabescens]KAK0461426.1 ribosomal protein S10 domain-containing protein [Desarmillaria tabescens]
MNTRQDPSSKPLPCAPFLDSNQWYSSSVSRPAQNAKEMFNAGRRLLQGSSSTLSRIRPGRKTLESNLRDVDEEAKMLPIPAASLDTEFTEREYASALIHGRSFHLPYYHPHTHSIPVASIQFRSHFPRLLDLFTHFASHAASSLAIPVSRVVMLPTQRSMWTVPRSPFAYKKSQENFERKVHKRMIKAWDADEEVVRRWILYLQRHNMGGVGMRTTVWERLPLGLGRIESTRGTVQVTEAGAKIKQLGEKIVKEELAALSGRGT